MKLYDAVIIANRFVSYSNRDGRDVNLLSLLKLVFFSHGWHLAIRGEPLIKDMIEAAQFGPTIPSIYQAFKHNQLNPISEFGPPLDDDEWYVDSWTEELLERIWDTYGRMHPYKLSEITRRKDSPWDITWNRLGAKHRVGMDIPDELIKNYYAEKKKENERSNQTTATTN